jgi:hypothetical protein
MSISILLPFGKPNPPRGVLSAVNALHLNQPGGERGVMALDKILPLGDLFSPNELQEGQIHVIAQLPLGRENFTDKSRLLPMSESPPAFETEITFTIPSKMGFQSLKKTDINAEDVECAPVEDMPPFLQKFLDDLARQRCVAANVSAVVTSLYFPLFFFLILHSHHSS